MSDNGVKVKVTRGGCLGCLVFIIAGWALLFGVTWNGVHHGIQCSRARGVEVK